jgi:hypothetical protein
MKALLAALVFVAVAQPAAQAAEKLIPFSDPAVYFPPVLGKQVNIRFSDAFASGHFGKSDFDGVIVSDLTDGKVCFFGHDQGLDPDDPKLKDIARPDQADICVPRSEVAVRYAPTEAADAPPTPFYATDKKACTWSWKRGRDIGIWAEDCNFDSSQWNVVYDEKNDLFALTVAGSDPFSVLRQFHKKPEEGLEALLPGLRKAGLIPDDNECQFAPSTDQVGPPGWSLFEIVPTGKRKEQYDAQPGDDIPDAPCGELGYGVDFVGFFMVPDTHKDRVIYVNLGQDGTMFDPFTIALF